LYIALQQFCGNKELPARPDICLSCLVFFAILLGSFMTANENTPICPAANMAAIKIFIFFKAWETDPGVQE